MLTIDSDSALLEALGFSRSEAGDALGRTRQAIDAGLGSGRRDYLKPHELATLLLLARRRRHAFNVGMVRRYLATTRPGGLEAVDDLIGAASGGALASRRRFMLWVILPDVRHLRRDAHGAESGAFRVLLDLPKTFPDAALTYICATTFEADLLKSELLASEAMDDQRVVVEAAVPAAAQMTMIVADPYEDPTVFVPTADGFVQIEYFEPVELIKNLKALFLDLLPGRPRVAVNRRR